jgi:type II secretory pathway pseudopilin PulG
MRADVDHPSRQAAGSPGAAEAGFTLLEVIVAFALLALTMSGLLYMGTVSTRGNTRSQNEAAAISLGIDKIEQLKNAGFAQATCPVSPETLGVYTRSCSIGAQYPLNGVPAKDLTVTVQWTGDGSILLSTTVISPPTMSSGALEQFPTVLVKSWSSQ